MDTRDATRPLAVSLAAKTFDAALQAVQAAWAGSDKREQFALLTTPSADGASLIQSDLRTALRQAGITTEQIAAVENSVQRVRSKAYKAVGCQPHIAKLENPMSCFELLLRHNLNLGRMEGLFADLGLSLPVVSSSILVASDHPATFEPLVMDLIYQRARYMARIPRSPTEEELVAARMWAQKEFGARITTDGAAWQALKPHCVTELVDVKALPRFCFLLHAPREGVPVYAAWFPTAKAVWTPNQNYTQQGAVIATQAGKDYSTSEWPYKWYFESWSDIPKADRPFGTLNLQLATQTKSSIGDHVSLAVWYPNVKL